MWQDAYETFSPEQTKTLEKFVTNTSSHVFVLKNLPEVIKGALFSRYSRSSLGLRSLLLKEFITDQTETNFDEIVNYNQKESQEDQTLAIQKAQQFYDRILDGYGDDSIGELGGAHLAIENISMLATKLIEDCRIGGSPLEKSTRYIYFDQKVNGHYQYFRDPVLMTSSHKERFIATCDNLFNTYSSLIPPLTEKIQAEFPQAPNVSKGAYTAALRAKVLDCLRGLLPASALTNMGVFGNGRFYEGLIHKLQCCSLGEMQEIGKRACHELAKVIPSFVRRAAETHHTHQAYQKFFEAQQKDVQHVTQKFAATALHNKDLTEVKLLRSDADAKEKIAAALLFPYSNVGLHELRQKVDQLSDEEIEEILEAGCRARVTRRHKSPRALENASFTFEILSDYGAYRDLHRHRALTQERQLLTCDFGYYIPEEILGTPMEAPYKEAMENAKHTYDTIAKDLKEEAQYVVPMAYRIRWYFTMNLRAIQWLTELRSGSAGHPTYRRIAQQMAQEVFNAHPSLKRFFKFVDFEGYTLGRMDQEERKLKKSAERAQLTH